MDMNKYIGKIIGTPRKRGGRRDLDGDGVPNRKDCQPRNTMRQDNQEKIIDLIDRIRLRGDREAYNELVSYFNKNKDSMIPGIAKDLKKSIVYAKKYLIK